MNKPFKNMINSSVEDADMHWLAQPEEILPAYVFLALAVCSSYISGAGLPITGSVGGMIG
ncbi:MAG: hypothetical protein ABI536_08210 [Gallionella sp.]